MSEAHVETLERDLREDPNPIRDLITYLKGKPSIRDLVGDRIYPVVGETDVYPMIVIRRSLSRYTHNLTGAEGSAKTTAEVTIFGDSYDLVVRIGFRIWKQLLGFGSATDKMGNTTHVQAITCQQDNDDFSPAIQGASLGKYVVNQAYELTFKISTQRPSP